MEQRKIAIVTGGSRGLGKSASLKLAAKGVGVILTYNSSEKEANDVVSEIRKAGGQAVALKLDTGKTAQFSDFVGSVKKALKENWQSDKFDILVNNAGVNSNLPFTEISEQQYDDLMNVNVKGVFFLTQKLLPVMNDAGRILNISSGLARFTFPGRSLYGMSKGALETLTRYLARELGPRQITVNILAPGPIETDFGGGVVRDNKDLNKMLAAQTALGRVGLPDDIGDLVANLVTDSTRWVTGQRIEASGGIFL